MNADAAAPRDETALVSVRGLKTFLYSDNRCNRAVNGASLEIKRGRTLCVVGESGCGKSMLASSIMQLLPPLARIEEGEIIFHGARGDIRIDEQAPNGRVMRSMRGTELAMIFQDPMTALNPVYSVGFQIMENLLYHAAMTRRERRERTLALLADMGVPDPHRRIRDYPHQLSGGMRQRVMIAMAMACSPSVLIADEPTTALDVTFQAQVFELMAKLRTSYGTAIMLITHDMGVVAELADEVAVMYMGNVVECGTVDEVLSTPRHPYTRNLLRSIPVLGRGKHQQVRPIPGSTPNPYDRPKGCQFAPRCEHCTQRCLDEMPPEEIVAGGHRVRCWNHGRLAGDE